jgi:hypothetical protein
LLKDLIDARHLLATAFHVEGAHLLRNSLSLLSGDGGETLGFEEVDAGSFRPEIRF